MKARGLLFNISENYYLIFLIVMFFVAQLLYHLAHSGFLSSFFGLDLMIVDIGAITAVKGHFWESICYYHLSPPLYALYGAIFHILLPPDGELGFYLCIPS